MVVMVTPDLLTEVNKTLGYHLKVSTMTKSQNQLLDGTKERKLIKEETTHYHHHQVILVGIPTQKTMTMKITTKMEMMGGAGEVDVRNETLEDHRFQEMLLPQLGQYLNLCRVSGLHSDQQKTLRYLPIFCKKKITKMLETS